MLNLKQLKELFVDLGIPQTGQNLVLKARKEAPVRRVNSSRNTVTKYNSQKMGVYIDTESRKGEYYAALRYEHDDNVLEYHPQPCQLPIVRTNGNRIKNSYVINYPDFLVIRKNIILLEDWRDEKKLLKIAAKKPGRVVREEDGWHDPDMEKYLSSFGIAYRLSSLNEHPEQFIRNLEFLSDYINYSYPKVDKWKYDSIKEVLSENPILSIEGLIELLGEKFNCDLGTYIKHSTSEDKILSDDIYKLIADGLITFDMYNDDISRTHIAQVYRDKVTMVFDQNSFSNPVTNDVRRLDTSIKIGTEITYETTAYKVILIGREKVTIQSEDGTVELPLDVIHQYFPVWQNYHSFRN